MPFVPTPFVAGATMVWGDVASNFLALREWINAIPSNSVTAGSIRREHLVRPVIQPFPVNGAHSTFQAVLGSKFGIETLPALERAEWGPKIDRLTIFPLETGAVEETSGLERWVTPIGKPIFIVKDTHVSVTLQFDLQVRSDGSAAPLYPDGVGGGSRAGYFLLVIYDRQNNTEDLRQFRIVYPIDPPPPLTSTKSMDRVCFHSTFNLTAGAYDVALVYYRGNGADLVRQLDLSSITCHVELI